MLEVLTYPDKRLKQISKPVDIFDEKLSVLLDEMFHTMRTKEGIGLAAIQVNIPKRVLIVELFDEEKKEPSGNIMEFVNPEIIFMEGEQKYSEGCLSVPTFYEDITRAENIKVKYQNRYGEHCELDATGLLAVVLQHEIDHLNGRLFFERLSILKRKKFEKEYAEIKANGKTSRRNS